MPLRERKNRKDSTYPHLKIVICSDRSNSNPKGKKLLLSSDNRAKYFIYSDVFSDYESIIYLQKHL